MDRVAKLSPALVTILVHQACDGIIGTAQPVFDDHEQGWTLGEWRTVLAAIKTAIRRCFKLLQGDQIDASSLEALGLSGEHAAAFAAALNARVKTVKQALIHEAITQGATTLVDFDWQAAMALSSNSLADVSQPLVTLQLKLREPTGVPRTVRLELAPDELAAWLTSLKNAQMAMHQVLVE
eukprot:TRINITY_DN6184_c0_g1_i1.p1 TRINITY_DN6184_c0_g1~~TRINITY_DN6184_c0_g1_i1.p1  ORF type:complete len:181 (+),score=51.25 TRINITY_DN6184_c0_g1_i1:110-652(+)